jgi:hypothetical protein
MWEVISTLTGRTDRSMRTPCSMTGRRSMTRRSGVWRRLKARICWTRISGAAAGLVDFVDAGLGGMIRRDIHAEELDVAEDDGEEVVEVVGNAAGELSEGLHLLDCRSWDSSWRFSASACMRPEMSWI